MSARTIGVVAFAIIATTVTVIVAQSKGGVPAAAAKAVTAEELGKQWRYPGTGNEADKTGDLWVWEYTGPVDKALTNLNLTSLQFSQPKATFEEVWNFYADNCGSKEKWKKNQVVAMIEKTEEGQRMVADMTPGIRRSEKAPEETHFALITAAATVHVEIRKVDADYTAIRVFTSLR